MNLSRYRFGARSKTNLALVHPDLIGLMYLSILHPDCPFDFAITQGARSLSQQRHFVKVGASQTLNSRHLVSADAVLKTPCCHAVDVAIIIDGVARWEFPLYRQLAGHVQQISEQMGVEIEWGGDWESRDGPHFQLHWDQYPANRLDQGDTHA